MPTWVQAPRPPTNCSVEQRCRMATDAAPAGTPPQTANCYHGPMKPLVWLCILSATAPPLVRADETSKAAKIAELMQLTAERQFLHEVDSKLDQEAAMRAWARSYSANVTEPELDAILAYYRSPAGQKDVSASRAALAQVKSDTHEKHSPTPSTLVGTIPSAPASRTATPPQAAPASPAPSPGSIRQTTSPPRAPDGPITPSPTSPEQCEVTSTSTSPPTPSSPTHASGRSVVCVCTDEKGTLTRDPVIAESSGDPRVDSGAIKMARIDSGRYTPPTSNGQPQPACFRFAIDFSHHP